VPCCEWEHKQQQPLQSSGLSHKNATSKQLFTQQRTSNAYKNCNTSGVSKDGLGLTHLWWDRHANNGNMMHGFTHVQWNGFTHVQWNIHTTQAHNIVYML
jgi:hypothetical protein